MLKHIKENIISWAAVLFWMLLIFILSSQSATQSSGLSQRLTEIIIDIVEKWLPISTESSTETNLVLKYNHIVRKSAHFFAYSILSILVLNAIRRSGVYGIKGIVIALSITIFYAASDEFHQLFVPGRGGQIKDVLLDSVGATCGVLVYLLISKVKKILISTRL